MTDDTPPAHKSTRSDKSVDVGWNPPATRAQPVFIHEGVCEYCGRHFTIESLQPVAPLYCLKSENPDCYRRRKAAYMKSYRGKKKAEGDADE